ncbi:MAG: hypothetical protein U0401_22880 [Anaerolineae bacterium]
MSLVEQMRRLLSGEALEMKLPETEPENQFPEMIYTAAPLDAIAPAW